MVSAIGNPISEFWGIRFQCAHWLGAIKIYFIVLMVEKNAGASKIYQLDIKSVVNENVLCLNVSVGDTRIVQMLNR